MAIPAFDDETGYLPDGLYDATLTEVREVLGFSKERRRLIAGLERAANSLWSAGVDDLRIDGSFVTAKPVPGDIDGFWVWNPRVVYEEIDPLLRDWSTVADPVSGKPKFPMWYELGVELYVHPFDMGAPGIDFPTFFSHSRDNVPRGYVRVVPDQRDVRKEP
jgi:hypothetical protein